GLNKVTFDDRKHTVKFTVPGMSLDFGGIAKGVAVQIAVEKIRALGIRHAVVNLGGNMYCLGFPPAPRKLYVIGIRNPLDKKEICTKLTVRNRGIATSGNYERYVTINGRPYTHIMNPRTGKPVADMLSVTVVCPNAGDADFLSTAIFIKGAGFAEKLCKYNPQLEAVIIRINPADKLHPAITRFGAGSSQ
ncbi:MAG: FAD:protein FMN transferase, partial [Victivallales bacterium]|nr:FAD:protein FMN transferase [Victivallales bacterium]